MSHPDLDPRFALVVARLAIAPQDSRAGLQRHAEQIAAGCGRTYPEALVDLEYAQKLAADSQAAISPDPLQPQRDITETPPTAGFQAFGAISQRVVDRLHADPAIGTRQLAREIGCAANLVVRARRRLGLPALTVHTGARLP